MAPKIRSHFDGADGTIGATEFRSSNYFTKNLKNDVQLISKL
jgi:hypothetical protein